MADRTAWQDSYDRSPKRPAPFETMSGVPLEPVYGPPARSCPVSTPTRVDRTRPCTARGCGRCDSSPASGPREDTNGRFKELLRSGGDGLSTAFDMPTLFGARLR